MPGSVSFSSVITKRTIDFDVSEQIEITGPKDLKFLLSFNFKSSHSPQS